VVVFIRHVNNGSLKIQEANWVGKARGELAPPTLEKRMFRYDEVDADTFPVKKELRKEIIGKAYAAKLSRNPVRIEIEDDLIVGLETE